MIGREHSSSVSSAAVFVLMLAYVTSARPYTREDCSPCVCSFRSRPAPSQFRVKADCSSLGLEAIPQHLPEFTELLVLTNNSLLTVRERELVRYKSLKRLQLGYNRLVSIEPDVFEQCPTLHYLDLTGNALIVLPEAVFKKARLLRELHGIQMGDFPSNMFSHLDQLKVLTMVAAQTELPTDIFSNVHLTHLDLELREAREIQSEIIRPLNSTLVELRVKAPKLRSLPEDAFDGMLHLKKISLDTPEMATLPEAILHGEVVQTTVDITEIHEMVANILGDFVAARHEMILQEVTLIGIRQLPAKLFRRTPYLERLTIHEADSISPELFSNLRRLSTLDLSHNNLSSSQLDPAWFDDLDGLKVLNVSHNDLTDLQQQLQQLRGLAVLDASHNRLSHVEPEAFHTFSIALEQLDLSYNDLSDLSQTLFQTMWSLHDLDLSYNRIGSLPAGVFEDLQKLQTLMLQHNDLQVIHQSSLQGLQDITELHVHGNDLTDIPQLDAPFLTHLDLSHNNITALGEAVLSNTYSLERLDLEQNTLVCECGMMTQLEHLVTNMGTNVTGRCLPYGSSVAVRLVEVNVTEMCLLEASNMTAVTLDSSTVLPTIESNYIISDNITNNSTVIPAERNVTATRVSDTSSRLDDANTTESSGIVVRVEVNTTTVPPIYITSFHIADGNRTESLEIAGSVEPNVTAVLPSHNSSHHIADADRTESLDTTGSAELNKTRVLPSHKTSFRLSDANRTETLDTVVSVELNKTRVLPSHNTSSHLAEANSTESLDTVVSLELNMTTVLPSHNTSFHLADSNSTESLDNHTVVSVELNKTSFHIADANSTASLDTVVSVELNMTTVSPSHNTDVESPPSPPVSSGETISELGTLKSSVDISKTGLPGTGAQATGTQTGTNNTSTIILAISGTAIFIAMVAIAGFFILKGRGLIGNANNRRAHQARNEPAADDLNRSTVPLDDFERRSI